MVSRVFSGRAGRSIATNYVRAATSAQAPRPAPYPVQRGLTAAMRTAGQKEGATLRIIGLANDAPALLAPLEQSGHLTNVHFFAPTTRGPDGKLFRFHVEARVEPRTKIAEE